MVKEKEKEEFRSYLEFQSWNKFERELRLVRNQDIVTWLLCKELIDKLKIDELNIEELKKNKVYWTGLTKDMAENIQPRFQANIHKENFSLDQLSKSTRQAIRTARNKGLEVK